MEDLEKIEYSEKIIGQGWTHQSGNYITIALKKEDIMNIEPNKFGEIKVKINKRLKPTENSKSDYCVKMFKDNK
jgi:hypothetical protein